MEIEKKYLVRELPKGYEDFPCKSIEQGYLCQRPAVRIRKIGEDYVLTYKAPREAVRSGGARMNMEIEAPLSEEGYLHLREKADGHLIRKRRYRIPLEGGFVAELDLFEGRLAGLAEVEVEFPSVESAEAFAPPDWFGEDVSLDGRYVNHNLIYAENTDGLI